MTEEQANVLADVFNMLCGIGKPSADTHENRDHTWSVVLRWGNHRQSVLLPDAGEFARALKEHIDRD